MRTLILLVLLTHLAGCDSPSARPAASASVTDPAPTATANLPSRLSQFPRPPNDNGWGVHWAATTLAEPKNVVDYFVAESTAMGIKWVKFLNADSPKLEHEYLVRTLVANGMMPVMRIYTPFNEPFQHLRELVRAARQAGVYYFELYNEPNVSGKAGGWHDGEAINITRLVDLWITAGETIVQAGGYPGLPSLAPGGDYDDNEFLRAFLAELKTRGRADLVARAWLPLHNYFLNHPVDYPDDDVNLKSVPLEASEIERRRLTPTQVAAINHARLVSHLARTPGGHTVMDKPSDDSNGFRKFEMYERIFMSRFGHEVPIISTEGGAIGGAREDPRYPSLDDGDVSAETLYAYQYMLQQAPAYYFAFTPWILANFAGGHGDPRFEAAAWYKAINGPTLPVVAALKRNPLIGQVRVHQP